MKHRDSTSTLYASMLVIALLAVATTTVCSTGCRSAGTEEAKERPPVVQDMNIVAPSDGSLSK